jgi:hypothetical protein
MWCMLAPQLLDLLAVRRVRCLHAHMPLYLPISRMSDVHTMPWFQSFLFVEGGFYWGGGGAPHAAAPAPPQLTWQTWQRPLLA